MDGDFVGVFKIAGLFMRSDGFSTKWPFPMPFMACFWAANCVVKLIICDNLLGNDSRVCGIDSIDVLILFTGNDCGRVILVTFELNPFPFVIAEHFELVSR